MEACRGLKRLRGAEVIMGTPILAVKREYDEAVDGATVPRPLLCPQRGGGRWRTFALPTVACLVP